jgi:hypothetical protein
VQAAIDVKPHSWLVRIQGEEGVRDHGICLHKLIPGNVLLESIKAAIAREVSQPGLNQAEKQQRVSKL